MSRVLIVEDDDLVRRTYRKVLERAGHEVIAAATVTAARALLRGSGERPFEVVLLDLCLPDGSGADLLPLVRSLHPPPAVAVVSGHLDAESAVDLQYGSVLVVPKLHVSRLLADVVRELARPDEAVLVEAFAREVGLTAREAEVLRLACARVPNKEIPERMGCSVGTLRTHWRHIYAKTGTSSRDDAVAAVTQFAGRRRVTPPLGHPRVQ